MKTNRIFWGLSIMLFGSVMLLKTLGILHFNIWKFMGPAFLILLGLWFIYNAILHPKPEAPESLSIPTDGAEELNLSIAHGAGHLNIGALTATNLLLSGTFTNGIDSQVKRMGNTAEITLKPFGDPVNFMLPGNFQGLNWDMKINPELPTRIELKAGASESMLDLSQVNLQKLDISTGASKTTVTFSEKANQCFAKINAGVAEVSLQVPMQVAASIVVHGKELSSIKVNTSRFLQNGDRYESADYATAEKKLDIEVNPGLGEINIH